MCFLNQFCSEGDQLPKFDHLFTSMGVDASSSRLSLESVESGWGCTESLHNDFLGGVVKEMGGGEKVLLTLLIVMEVLIFLNISDKLSVVDVVEVILGVCWFGAGGGGELLCEDAKMIGWLGRGACGAVGGK